MIVDLSWLTDPKQFKSRFFIGLSALADRFWRLIGRNKGDPQKWLEALAEEKLAPSTLVGWKEVSEASRCLSCGICEYESEALFALIVTKGRRPEDTDLLMASVNEDTPVDPLKPLYTSAEKISQICPVGIHPDRIAKLLIDHATMLKLKH